VAVEVGVGVQLFVLIFVLIFVVTSLLSGLTFGAFGSMQTPMQIWTTNADDERAYY